MSAEQTPRLLTAKEVRGCMFRLRTGSRDMPTAMVIDPAVLQRKFCEINGLPAPAPAPVTASAGQPE